MLRLDINLVFTIINLLIWYAIIRIFLFKPINKVIDKRNAAIQEKYDEAKKMQEEAQAEKEKYAACQDEIEVEKNKVLDAARASAREEGRQLIENAQKEADKVIRKAGEDARREKDKMLEQAKHEILSLVLDAAAGSMNKKSDLEANKWELSHGGLSGRTATQFIANLRSKLKGEIK